MALNVGTIEALLKLRDDLSPALKIAVRNLEQSGSAMKSAAGNLAPLAAGLGLVGGAAVKMAVDFNTSMANVASLIPGSTARVNELKTAVQEMSVTTGKSTKDLAGGLYQVLSAFGNTADTAKILEINARAAAAGLATTEQAIALTSSVTKGYGDTSADAVAAVSDLAQKTVQLGQTTFPELAASIGKVVPLATNLNISQRELFATMATVAGVTGNAAEASTQMRGAMQAFLQPTTAMTALLKEYGFANGKAMIDSLGFQGALEKVANAAKSSGAPLAEYIGSIEGQTIALSLAGAQAEGYKSNLDGMAKATGASAEAFKEQTQGINAAGFAWAQFQAKVTVMAQNLGDALIPTLTRAGEAMLPLIGYAERAVAWFGQLPQPVQTFAIALGAIVIAAAPVLFVLGSLAEGLAVVVGLGPLLAAGCVKAAAGVTMLGNTVPVLTARLWLMQAGGQAATLSLGTLGAVAAAAFVGWGIGTLLRELTGLGDYLDGLADKAAGLTKNVGEARAMSDSEREAIKDNKRIFAAQDLKKNGGSLFGGLGNSVDAFGKASGGSGGPEKGIADAERAKKAAEEAAAAFKANADAIRDLTNAYSGADIAKQASQMEAASKAAIAMAGGVDKLSAAQLDKIGTDIESLVKGGLEKLPSSLAAVKQRVDTLRFDKFKAEILDTRTATQKYVDTLREMSAGDPIAESLASWIELSEQADKAEAAADDYTEVLKVMAQQMGMLSGMGTDVFASAFGVGGPQGDGTALAGRATLIRQNVIEMTAEVEKQKELNKVRQESLALMLKEGTIDRSEFLDMGGVDAAERTRVAWLQASEAIAGAFSGMGGIFDKIGSTASNAANIAANWGSAQGKGKTGQKIAAGAQAAGDAVAIWKDNESNLSGASAYNNGAQRGMAAGSAYGPYGAAAGAFIGGLLGYFAGKKFREIAKVAGAALGEELSAESVKAIKQTMEDLDVDAATAALLNLGSVMGDGFEKSGKTAAQYFPQIQQLFAGIADGSIPAEAGVKAIGEAWGEAMKQADEAGRKFDGASISILNAAKATGNLSQEMKDYMSANNQQGAAGAKTIATGMKGFDPSAAVERGLLTAEQAQQFGTDAGEFYSAGFRMAIKEEGLIGALDSQSAGLDDMVAMFEASGNEAGLAMLAPFRELQAQLGGEDNPLRAMLQTLEGSNQVFEAVAKNGDLTRGQFEAMERQVNSTADALSAAGISGEAGMQATYEQLKNVIEASRVYGFELDADTLALKAQAEAAGFSFPTEPIQQVVDLLKVLVVTMGGELPQSAQTGAAALAATGAAGTLAANEIGDRMAALAGETDAALGEVAAKAATFSGEAVAAFEPVADSVTTAVDAAAEVTSGLIDAVVLNLAALAQGVTIPVTWDESGQPVMPGGDTPEPILGERAAGGWMMREGLYRGAERGPELVVPTGMLTTGGTIGGVRVGPDGINTGGEGGGNVSVGDVSVMMNVESGMDFEMVREAAVAGVLQALTENPRGFADRVRRKVR